MRSAALSLDPPRDDDPLTRSDASADEAVDAILEALAEGVADALERRPVRRPDLIERARRLEAREDLPAEVATLARLARELLESGPEDPRGLAAALGAGVGIEG